MPLSSPSIYLQQQKNLQPARLMVTLSLPFHSTALQRTSTPPPPSLNTASQKQINVYGYSCTVTAPEAESTNQTQHTNTLFRSD